jgi:hypothetical protein
MIGHPATLITIMVAVAVVRSASPPKPAPRFVCNASESVPNELYRTAGGQADCHQSCRCASTRTACDLPHERRLLPTRFAAHRAHHRALRADPCAAKRPPDFGRWNCDGRWTRARSPRSPAAPPARSFARTGVSRRRSTASTSVRFLLRNHRPSQIAMELREGATMQPLCKPLAVPPIDQEPFPRPEQVPIRRRPQRRSKGRPRTAIRAAAAGPARYRAPCPG